MIEEKSEFEIIEEDFDLVEKHNDVRKNICEIEEIQKAIGLSIADYVLITQVKNSDDSDIKILEPYIKQQIWKELCYLRKLMSFKQNCDMKHMHLFKSMNSLFIDSSKMIDFRSYYQKLFLHIESNCDTVEDAMRMFDLDVNMLKFNRDYNEKMMELKELRKKKIALDEKYDTLVKYEKSEIEYIKEKKRYEMEKEKVFSKVLMDRNETCNIVENIVENIAENETQYRNPNGKHSVEIAEHENINNEIMETKKVIDKKKLKIKTKQEKMKAAIKMKEEVLNTFNEKMEKSMKYSYVDETKEFSIQCLDIQLIENCKSYLIFGRNENGKSSCIRVSGCKSYFFIRSNKLEGNYKFLEGLLKKGVKLYTRHTSFNSGRYERETSILSQPNIGTGFGISQFQNTDEFKFKRIHIEINEVSGRSVVGYEAEESTFLKVSFEYYFYMKKAAEFLNDVKNTLAEKIWTIEEIKEKINELTLEVEDAEMGNIINSKAKKQLLIFQYVDSNPEIMKSMEIFESNISPKMRFMVDKEIVGCGTLICKDFKNVGIAERISNCENEILVDYKNLKGDKADVKNFPLRLLAFDIECMSINVNEFPTPKDCPVIQISMHSRVLFSSEPEEKKIVLCLSETSPIENGEIMWYKTESQLLHAFCKYVIVDFQADIIAGYNSNGFDLPYLLDRANQLELFCFPLFSKLKGTPVKYWKQRFQSQQAGVRESTHFHIPGIVTMDVFDLIKATMNLRSYSLNNVSLEVLKNQKKEDLAYSDIPKLQNGTAMDRAVIASYCMQDTLLVSALIDKRMLLINSIEMARTVGTTLHEVLTKGQGYKILRKIMEYTVRDAYFIPTFTKKNGIPHVPLYDKVYAENPKREYFDMNGNLKFQGAFVLDPKAGLHDKPVATLDFASLYPSIMRFWNLCPTTLLKSEADAASRNLSKDEYTVMTSGFVFVKNKKYQGLLPKIETELHSARKQAKKEMSDARKSGNTMLSSVLDGKQLAIKVIMNSIYGFCGSKTSPIPCLAVAVSITSRGRHDIMKSKDWVEKNFGVTFLKDRGRAEVIYGDTDSIMIKFSGANNQEEAMKFAKECEKRINDIKHPETPGLFSYPMFLEYEKVFFPYFLLGKKRYISMKYEDDPNSGKLSYSGIELVRRDNCMLLNKCMKEYIDKLIVHKDTNAAIQAVKNTVQLLFNNDIPIEQLIMSKKVSKLEYTNKQPHIEVVKRLQVKNPLQAPKLGDRCEFLICHTGESKIFDKARHISEVESNNIPVDYSYYLEKQVRKPMSRLIEPIIGQQKTDSLFRKSNYIIKKRKMDTIMKNGILDMLNKKAK